MEIGYIKKRAITDEMKDSYLAYAMSVIISRALPDVRDGLKPVHRRILYAMHRMGLNSSAKFRKSATIVGETLGKYHPHGDMAVYESMVKMTQEFHARYPMVKGQGNFGCFTKDTKIKLTDGRDLTFGELIKEYKKGKRNWTFSFNSDNKEIEVAEIKNPRLTRKDEKVMEITLDNGKKIKCTLDHLFMVRNGSYKKAKDLKPSDSLMPLYDEIYQGEDANLKGYAVVRQPFKHTWDFVHRLADKWNLANGVYKKNKGKIRHHLDFNKLNNNPDNILRLQWGEHWQYHKEIASWRHKNDAGYVKKIAEGRRKFWAKKENREKAALMLSELNKKNWKNPVYREKMSEMVKEAWSNLEYRERASQVSSRNMRSLWQRKDFQELMSESKSKELKKKWQDEKYRERMSQMMREISLEIWSDPKHREYISKLTKERFENPEERKRQSEMSKKLWQNPEYRAKYPDDHFSQMAKKLWENPKTREFHSKKATEQWQNPEFSKKMSELTSARNKQRCKENPEFMKDLAGKAKVSLLKNWQNPSYKKRVIKSKILGFVHSLLGKRKKITPEIYERERTNNGVPKLENALNYFSNFSEIVSESKKYNHRIATAKILRKKEDVYDLTIEPHHNFCLGAGIFVHNSMDGDNAAAPRYTEAKMNKIAEEMLADIDKETIDWVDNYDGSTKEPSVLPAKLPQLLLNGGMGIAVGMATNIPPHNLGELIDGIIYLISNPKATVQDLFQFIKGPDFPTGGEIYDRQGMIQAYSSGRGPIVSRAKAEIVEEKAGKFQIIVKEMTYAVNKANLIIKIADLVKSKKLQGIKEIRDESDKDGVRLVIGLKSDTQPQKVLNRLFKLTDLQKTFHLNMLALVDGIQPQVLSLKGVLDEYVKHRRTVVTRRAQFELKQAREREHILLGLNKALDFIDEVIKTIRSSADKDTAHKNLVKRFKLSDLQASAILEMRLQALAGLERQKIKDELEEKKKIIKKLEALLKSQKKIMDLIKKELEELKEKYADKRRTKVFSRPVGELTDEELIPQEENIIILTRGGYIKRMNPQAYKSQKRGGKGVVGITPREEDAVGHFISASTHDPILFFTNQGRVFQIKAHEIPEASRVARGQAIVNILQLGAKEKIATVLDMSGPVEGKYLVMVTKNGIIKRTKIDDFKNTRKSGLIALKLSASDRLRWAVLTSGKDEIVLITAKGQSIRFKEGDVRVMGRGAAGVKGVALKEGDRLIGMGIVEEKAEKKNLKILVVTENGLGKKTDLKYYKTQKRGGMGIKTAKIGEKTGDIVAGHILSPETKDLIAISKQGQVIRMEVKSIPELGRATQGVKIMRLNGNDKVVTAACI